MFSIQQVQQPITIKRVLPIDPAVMKQAALKEAQNGRQRTGSLLALLSLLRIFSTNQGDPMILASRLPTLWSFLWCEPVAILRSLFSPSTVSPVDDAVNDTASFDADVAFIRWSKFA